MGHQICQFHVKRWVGKALRGFRSTVPKEWLWVLDEVAELIEALPPEGDERLVALWRQIPVRRSGQSRPLSALQQLRDLLLRLSERWQEYCTFQREPEVPWTNNLTETGHRADEDACLYRTGLQDLAGHADRPDAGRR